MATDDLRYADDRAVLPTLLFMIVGLASGLLAYHRCRPHRPDARPVRLAGSLIIIGVCIGTVVATANVSLMTRIVLTHLVITCLPLAAVDALTGKLPRRQVLTAYPSTAAVVGVAVWWSGSATAGLGAAVGAAGMWLLFLVLACFGGMGAGDVRLAPLLGAHLGHAGILVVLNGTVASFALGAMTAVALTASKRLEADHRVSFAPALLGGAILALAT